MNRTKGPVHGLLAAQWCCISSKNIIGSLALEQKLCCSFAFSTEWSDTHSPSAGVVCGVACCHESSFVHGPKIWTFAAEVLWRSLHVSRICGPSFESRQCPFLVTLHSVFTAQVHHVEDYKYNDASRIDAVGLRPYRWVPYERFNDRVS